MDRAHRQPLTPWSVLAAFVTLCSLAAVGSAQLFNFRERARAETCRNNLRQLGLAIFVYDSLKQTCPGYHAAVVGKDGKTYSRPLLYQIFPQLERNDLYEKYNAENHAEDGVKETYLSFMVCPSANADGKASGAASHYVFNTGMPDVKSEKFAPDWIANGVFQDNFSSKRTSSFNYISAHDGMTNTLMLSERAEIGRWTATAESEVGFVWSPRFKDKPWAKVNSNVEPKALSKTADDKKTADAKSKTHDQPAIAGKEGDKKEDGEKKWVLTRPSSKHPKVINVTFCDAHTRPLRDTIDYIVYAQLLSPNGSKAMYPGTEELVEKEFREYELKEKDFD
jgi:hypothetical protein